MSKTPTTQHTPGDWEYFEQSNWCELTTYGCIRVKHGAVILNGSMEDGHQKANARLWAAAPNLLAALEEVVGCINHNYTLKTMDYEYGEQIRAAITKAKELK